MIMNIAALIISIFAVIFAGVLTFITFREQKLRLRPYIYVDSANENISTVTNTIMIELVIKNGGLMTAKNVTISPVISINGIPQQQMTFENPPKAIIVPQQILLNPMQIQGETVQKVLQGEVDAKLDIHIDYESAGQKYFYKGNYTFLPLTKRWMLMDGDAN